MIVYCNYCGKQITAREIRKQCRRVRTSHCLRFLYMYTCECCNKGFDYRRIINHKKIFNETLTQIRVYYSSNV